MVSEKFNITNKMGLHMRPASTFVQTMAKYQSDVRILFDGKSIDGKSIMSIMGARIKCGAEIEIQCDGADEQEMLQAAADLIQSGFGEE